MPDALNHPASGATQAEYDALTDLFLSDAAMAPASRARGGEGDAGTQTESTPVEALIVGHLPVLGTAWVGAYASHRAGQIGRAVGLVRLSEEGAIIDLVGAPGMARPAKVAAESFDDAVRAAGRHAGLWIIAPEGQDEEAVAASAGVSRVTVLTGADDPAVLACYGVMKRVAEHGATRLHVAIMGADAARAADAQARLGQTARSSLGLTLPKVDVVARIGAASVSPVYSGRGPEVEAIAGLLAGAGARQGGYEREGSPLRFERGPGRGDPEVVVMAEHRSQRQRGSGGTPVTSGPASRTGGAPVQLGPPRGAESSLPEGLEALGSLCPAAPGIEVCRDREGRVHLVARLGRGTQARPGGPAGELLTAAAWCAMNAGLLGRAFPGLDGGEPTLHVLTVSAPEVRGLLDTAIRLHLVVEAAGVAVCRPLN